MRKKEGKGGGIKRDVKKSRTLKEKENNINKKERIMKKKVTTREKREGKVVKIIQN